jgi:CarboxypepD_reg-like domain
LPPDFHQAVIVSNLFTSLLYLQKMLLRYSEISGFLPQVIKGEVYDKKNKQPLANAQVYILKGAEETITNNCGAFAITTWQHFPLVLTIKTEGYPESKTELRNAPENPIILLIQQ